MKIHHLEAGYGNWPSDFLLPFSTSLSFCSIFWAFWPTLSSKPVISKVLHCCCPCLLCPFSCFILMVACLISVKILMTVFSFASFWVDFDLFEFTNTSDISSRTEVLALTRVTRTSQHVASVSLAFPVGRSGSVFSWRNSEVSCCSVAQSCLTLYTPVVCSTPGFPVLHHLLELAQTHVP